jgi:hypothetical protein
MLTRLSLNYLVAAMSVGIAVIVTLKLGGHKGHCHSLLLLGYVQ